MDFFGGLGLLSDACEGACGGRKIVRIPESRQNLNSPPRFGGGDELEGFLLYRIDELVLKFGRGFILVQ